MFLKEFYNHNNHNENSDMENVITIKESDLKTILFAYTREILQELGVKSKPVSSEWISFNRATKIEPATLGRKKLEKAIALKLVRTRPKDHDKLNGVRLVNKKDVEYCIKQRLV